VITHTCRCGFCRAFHTTPRTGRRPTYCSTRGRVAAHRKRRRRSVHFKSISPDWATPRELFRELDAEFRFDLDPCSTPETATCPRYFTPADDGLAQEWTGRVFMNPPYGRAIGARMKRAWEASRATAEVVVCLVPARTDAAWWQDYASRGDVRFLRGRLRFGGAASGAPFPSAVVVFRNAAGVTNLAPEVPL
jgi:site-specific DNA-methyltransferase (adenine-specific)